MKKVTCHINKIHTLSEKNLQEGLDKYIREFVPSETYYENILDLAPNNFSEQFSLNYMMEQKWKVISGAPNNVKGTNKDSGEDIIAISGIFPFLLVIEVKGNGNNNTDKKINKHLTKSIRSSFGVNDTKKGSVTNKARDIKHEIQKIAHAFNEYIFGLDKGEIDAKYTQTHVYTNFTKQKDKYIIERELKPDIIGIHKVTVFDTSKLIKKEPYE